jgi:hypothetical protein
MQNPPPSPYPPPQYPPSAYQQQPQGGYPPPPQPNMSQLSSQAAQTAASLAAQAAQAAQAVQMAQNQVAQPQTAQTNTPQTFSAQGQAPQIIERRSTPQQPIIIPVPMGTIQVVQQPAAHKDEESEAVDEDFSGHEESEETVELSPVSEDTQQEELDSEERSESEEEPGIQTEELDEDPFEEPEAEPEENEIPAIPEEPDNTQIETDEEITEETSEEDELSDLAAKLRLFTYLENLTEYLPSDQKSNFLKGEMCLKLESLRRKLKGGGPGLLSRGEEYNRRKMPRDQKAIDAEKISSTLSFLGKLSDNHPNPEVSEALSSRVGHILRNLEKNSDGS